MPCVLGFNLLEQRCSRSARAAASWIWRTSCISDNILPLGSLVYLLFCVSRKGWGWKNFTEEANTGAGLRFPEKVRFYVTWILPFIMVLIFIVGYWNRFGSAIMGLFR